MTREIRGLDELIGKAITKEEVLKHITSCIVPELQLLLKIRKKPRTGKKEVLLDRLSSAYVEVPFKQEENEQLKKLRLEFKTIRDLREEKKKTTETKEEFVIGEEGWSAPPLYHEPPSVSFDSTRCGPQNVTLTSESNTLITLLDDELLDHLVEEINTILQSHPKDPYFVTRRGNPRKRFPNKNKSMGRRTGKVRKNLKNATYQIDRDILLRFFAILLWMMVDAKDEIRDYWGESGKDRKKQRSSPHFEVIIETGRESYCSSSSTQLLMLLIGPASEKRKDDEKQRDKQDDESERENDIHIEIESDEEFMKEMEEDVNIEIDSVSEVVVEKNEDKASNVNNNPQSTGIFPHSNQ